MSNNSSNNFTIYEFDWNGTLISQTPLQLSSGTKNRNYVLAVSHKYKHYFTFVNGWVYVFDWQGSQLTGLNLVTSAGYSINKVIFLNPDTILVSLTTFRLSLLRFNGSTWGYYNIVSTDTNEIATMTYLFNYLNNLVKGQG